MVQGIFGDRVRETSPELVGIPGEIAGDDDFCDVQDVYEQGDVVRGLVEKPMENIGVGGKARRFVVGEGKLGMARFILIVQEAAEFSGSEVVSVQNRVPYDDADAERESCSPVFLQVDVSEFPEKGQKIPYPLALGERLLPPAAAVRVVFQEYRNAGSFRDFLAYRKGAHDAEGIGLPDRSGIRIDDAGKADSYADDPFRAGPRSRGQRPVEFNDGFRNLFRVFFCLSRA